VNSLYTAFQHLYVHQHIGNFNIARTESKKKQTIIFILILKEGLYNKGDLRFFRGFTGCSCI